jgi:hypothetical protein
LLAALDHVLNRLGTGQSIGLERELARILEDEASPTALAAWSRRCRPRPEAADVDFDGILVGDGSTGDCVAHAFGKHPGQPHSIP